MIIKQSRQRLFNFLLFKPILLFILIIFLSIPILFSTLQAKIPGTQRPYVINNKRYYPIPSSQGFSQKGIASWYGSDFHGRRTSNGEIYDMYADTAAHKVLPMNTILLVKNLENGKETTVRVNDRGPFVYGRVIDLSFTAAKKIGIANKGTSKVLITALGQMKNTNKGRRVVPEQDFNKGEFYVQLGAFVEQSNATKLQRRFTDTGHTTVIQKFYTPKAIFYRVQVYVGQNLAGARRAEEALHNYGYKGAFVIAR